MKASEFLAEARDEIEKGWAKGTLQDMQGNVVSGHISTTPFGDVPKQVRQLFGRAS